MFSFFFYLFSISLSIAIGQCGKIFEENFDICKTDSTWESTKPNEQGQSSNEHYSLRSECATMAPFVMPVGWKDYKQKDINYAFYTTHDSYIIPEFDKLDGRSESEPKKIGEVVKEGNHKDFYKWCPMFDYNKRPDDESFQNRTTCCLHSNPASFAQYDATYVAGGFEIFQKHNLYQVYPKCYELIRYFPCMVCHPNIQDKDYIFQVGERTPDRYHVKIPVYTFRLCDHYATEIWNQCRRAFYMTDGRKLIVPENMGLEQFKELVGVNESLKCFNISDVNPFYEY